MFKFVVVFALISLAAADVRHILPKVNPSDDVNAVVNLYESDVRADGFKYALETSNGISLSQEGNEKGDISGQFAWVDPKGESVKIAYVADENGYQPKSDSLPTPPPIPEAILKSLEYIRSHPPKSDEKRR